MRHQLCILLVAIILMGCRKEENTSADENIMILKGQFQKTLYDKNIWDETIEGEITEINRSIQFVPQTEGTSTEDMFAKMGTDGTFTVKLKKGETYWNSLFYTGSVASGTEGQILFSEADGNFITVPDDAPSEFNLGTIQVATWLPYGGWLNKYIPEKPLPWLSDALIVNSTSAPVISEISKEETKLYDNDNNYMGSIIKFTPNISSPYATCCNWFLEDTDGRASFNQNNENILRTVTYGTKVSVYTDSFGGHGTLKLIVTDTHAGHNIFSISF